MKYFSVLLCIFILRCQPGSMLVQNFTVITGIVFNFSTPYITKNRVSFPWLETSDSFTYGIGPADMKGNKLLLTGTHEVHYQFIIDTHVSWRQAIVRDQCLCAHLPRFDNTSPQTRLAGIEWQRADIESRSASDRVALLNRIVRGAALARVDQVGLIMTREIMSHTLHQYLRRPRSNTYSAVWIINCTEDLVNTQNYLQTLKHVFKTLHHTIKPLNWFITDWPICQRSPRHRRSRFTGQQKSHIVLKILPTIKISELQIMNWNVPLHLFVLRPVSYDIQVFEIINNSRVPLDRNPNSWIKFSSSTNIVRFKPSSRDKGSRLLHVCTKGVPENENCLAMEVLVTPIPAQVHQIYIRVVRNPYVLYYNLPLAWFRSYDVVKDNDIQILSANASIPIVIEGNNRLLILNLGSLEDTVLELKVNVVIKNSSLIPLNLNLPIMSLADSKRSGYVFKTTIVWRSAYMNHSTYVLLHVKEVLETISATVSNLILSRGLVANITIFVLRLYKEAFISNEYPENNLSFDWTFTWNSKPRDPCILSVSSLQLQLLNTSLSCCTIANTTLHSKLLVSRCGPTTMAASRIVSSSTIVPSQPLLVSTAITSSKSDAELSPLLSTMNLRVECGRIFKHYLLTTTTSLSRDITSLKIVSDKRNDADWFAVTVDRKYLVGVVAVLSCPNKKVLIRLVGTTPFVQRPEIIEVTIDIVSSIILQDHKFQIEFSITPTVPIGALFIWNVMLRTKDYIRKSCIKRIDCSFDLSLLKFKIVNDKHIDFSIGYLERSIECLDSVAIFLQTLFVDKSHSGSDMPSVALMTMFQDNQLGQITHCVLIMRGPCKNKAIFPPDLGQKVAYNNVLTIISLRPFHKYYNRSVTFSISYSKMKFSNWIKVSSDSTRLFVLASTEHVSFQPYIIKLYIDAPVTTSVLQPKIALDVKNLVHHPLFYPYIRELNHQISVDVSTSQPIVDNILPLNVTIELCQMIDIKLRPYCNSSSDNDCGIDILVYLYSVSDVNNESFLNYKLSSLRVLKNSGSIDSTDQKKNKLKCPKEALNHMESMLKIQTMKFNSTWKLESIRVLALGPCIYDRTSYLRTRVVEEPVLTASDNRNENRVYMENNQQIFLMATVIPACSFIIITLFLGVSTACFLQYRRKKKLLKYTVKSRSNTPIIFLSDFDTYSPPSKPLILRHEKPPEPIPADEDILIANMHTVKYKYNL